MLIHEESAQTLGICLREQTAVGRARRQQMIPLEDVKLSRRRLQAGYLQLLTSRINLLHGKVLQNGVQYVVETQTFLASDHKTRDALVVEQGLEQRRCSRVGLHAL
jgi:hypothetical protein